MMKLQAAALALSLAAVPAVNAMGCYPAYVDGGSYISGSQVSATVTDDSTDPPTVTYYNYVCTDSANSAFCGNSGYAPGTQPGGSLAWVESGTCMGTAPVVPPPTPAAWSGGGCPRAYVGGETYDAGDDVSVDLGTYTAVFRCKAEPQNLFCGQTGFAPVEDQFWAQAWDDLGSCTGTISPTTAPSFDVLTDAGGCPSEFSGDADYDEGDTVSLGGMVYQCKPEPLSRHCSQAGYEPETNPATPGAWKDAWAVVGYCEGTISPTSSPNYDVLEDMGGCPTSWEQRTMEDPYLEGEKVSAGGLVFACKAWPYGNHCGQDGYEPTTNPATPDAWKDAWTVIGYCEGSIAPTGSPTIDAAASIGACPEEWERGSNVAYAEGDMVGVMVSEVPLRYVAFRCKAWPYSGFCGQLSPTEFGGDQGWTLVGGCDGSMGPTASPNFVELAEYGMGCPAAWSASKTDYDAGDLVAYTVSSDPDRVLVFECREWPNTGYCNQGAGFEPTTKYTGLAWIEKGYCTGSIAPTTAPVAYTGMCEFNKCVTTTTDVGCDPGSYGCSCLAGYPAGPTCVKEVATETCSDVAVGVWMSSVDYFTGDVVRVGTKRFKCREWPNYFWCRQEAYKPSLEDNNIWDQAWTEDGMCM